MVSKHSISRGKFLNTFSLLFLLTLIGDDISTYLPWLKYLKYSLVPFLLVLFFHRKALSSGAYFLMVPLVIAIFGPYTYRWRIEVELLLIIGLLSTLTYSVRIDLRAINILVIVFFFLVYWQDILLNISSFSLNKSIKETNTSSFYFPFFFLYWYHQKRKGLYWLNLIMTFITFKRVVLLAFVVWLISKFFKRKLSLVVLLNFGFVLASYLLTTEWLNTLSIDIIGLPLAHVTQGRSKFLEVLFLNLNPMKVLFGSGIGYSVDMVTTTLGYFTQIHSDIIKILFDAGLVSLVFSLWFLYRYVNFSLALILNVFMLTDNSTSYMSVMLLFVFIAIKMNEAKRIYK